MKRPVWVKLMTFLLILIGLCGFISGTFKYGMVSTLNKMDDPEYLKEFENNRSVQFEGNSLKDLKEAFDKSTDVPKWYQKLKPTFALLQLSFGFLFIVIGVMLFKLKPAAIKLSYVVLSASIIVSVAHLLMILKGASLMLIMNSPGLVFSLILDVVLLLIILLHNKNSFSSNTEMTESEAKI